MQPPLYIVGRYIPALLHHLHTHQQPIGLLAGITAAIPAKLHHPHASRLTVEQLPFVLGQPGHELIALEEVVVIRDLLAGWQLLCLRRGQQRGGRRSRRTPCTQGMSAQCVFLM